METTKVGKNKKPVKAKRAKLIADQATALADWTIKALDAAGQLRIKNRLVERLPLKRGEKVVLAKLPNFSSGLKEKLTETNGVFTVAEAISLVAVIAESLMEAEPLQQVALLMIARNVMPFLQERIMDSDPARAKKAANSSRST